MGNWLTRNQAQELVSAASRDSLRGLRDSAMLGLLLGCGLRHLTFAGATSLPGIAFVETR
jgi:site-specific recombinase XerD